MGLEYSGRLFAKAALSQLHLGTTFWVLAKEKQGHHFQHSTAVLCFALSLLRRMDLCMIGLALIWMHAIQDVLAIAMYSYHDI